MKRRKLTQEKADAINRRRDMREGTERDLEHETVRVVLDEDSASAWTWASADDGARPGAGVLVVTDRNGDHACAEAYDRGYQQALDDLGVLRGEDAAALLRELDASPLPDEERERRAKAARRWLAWIGSDPKTRGPL